MGGLSYSIRESWNALLVVPENEDNDIRQRIIWVLRVPRVLMEVVSGIGLASARLMMQTILRHPLVSPYTPSAYRFRRPSARPSVLFRG